MSGFRLRGALEPLPLAMDAREAQMHIRRRVASSRLRIQEIERILHFGTVQKVEAEHLAAELEQHADRLRQAAHNLRYCAPAEARA